ncbi:MAG: hypothetical protein ACK56F_05855, partial [bacterium]
MVRRVGRHSHTIQLLAEGPPLPLEQSMEAAREAVRNDLNTRQLGREPDAITTAVVSLEYDRERRPERYNVWLPVGHQPLGARGDGLDNAIRVLQHNDRARLEAMDVRNLVSRSK